MDRQRKRRLKRKKKPESEDDGLSNEDKIWKNLKVGASKLVADFEADTPPLRRRLLRGDSALFVWDNCREHKHDEHRDYLEVPVPGVDQV